MLSAVRGVGFFENMIRYSPDMICSINQNGNFIYASHACKSILGYCSEEVAGHHFLDFIHSEEQEVACNAVQETLSGLRSISFRSRCVHKSGKVVPVLWTLVLSEEEDVVYCTGRDITEKVLAEQKLREKDTLHLALIEHGTDMLALFDEEGNFLYSAGSTVNDLGYVPEQLVGSNAFEKIHPDDLQQVEQNFKALLDSPELVRKLELRYRRIDGEWRWLETTLNNQLHNPHIKALVGNSHDVTARKQSEQLIIESENQFRALFDNNPDTIFTESKDGVILDVNRAGVSFLNLQKHEIVGKSMSEFLPPDVAPICLSHLEQAFTGKTIKFNLTFTPEQRGEVVLDITKVPVVLDGKVIKVHTIVKDITELMQTHTTVQQQAKKLNNILESITNAFFILDKDWRIDYINKEAERFFNLYRECPSGGNFWEVFPSEVNGEFYQRYHHAVQTGESVHFEAYYAAGDIWVDVKAFPSEEGLSIYVDDISEQVKTRKELEKLSLVASKTTNGVIITNVNGVVEWVNEGFTNLTGYTAAEVVGTSAGVLLQGEETDKDTAARIIEKRKQGIPFREEILNYNKSGEKKWILVDSSPVLDDEGKISRFIAIQTDITETIRAKKELEMLSLVASKTTNGVIITDADRRIEWVNNGFVTLTGYSLNEAIGKRPSELLHNPKSDSKDFELVKERFLSGEPVAFEILNSTKDGEEIWLSIQVNPLFNKQGKIVRYITTQTDITALKRSELQLSKLAKDLYSQNRDLQQFTYIVSHNLRAPVANILGLAEMLVKLNRSTEVYDKFLENLKISVYRLDGVLKDLNMILSVRDFKNTLEKEQVDLGQKCRQVVDSLREPLQACGGEVDINIKEGIYINGNAAYLYSIFYNLLSNAIKYRAAERPLQICIKLYGCTKLGTFVSISDNGIGLDMSLTGKEMFKLYKRFHTYSEGKGIGLYLTKTHLEAMGGSIKVDSQVGVGTRFLLQLK